MKITIIGAGIAGLTTAIALRQVGFEVEIFETSKTFKKAGSGINLAINAMQVFKRLGVYEDILEQANYTCRMNATKEDLSVITSANFLKFEDKFKVKNVAIHRAVLHKILLSHIDGVTITFNKKLQDVVQKGDKVTLNFSDGSSHIADVVIGADGIHSMVRKSIFENTKLRDAKQICWRGIANIELKGDSLQELNEIWGLGKRFGFVPISPKEVYWYALINKDEKNRDDQDLKDLFSSYSPKVNEIITATSDEDIIFNEIWDLEPIDTWFEGKVCLVGDAAHATTPNLGQGACQAIESALALSISMSNEQDVNQAFRNYQQIRKKKAVGIVKNSWVVGKLGQTDNRLIYRIRNILTSIMPKRLTELQNGKVFKLNF